MEFSCAYFTAVVFCFTSIAGQSLDTFVVLRHPSTNNDSTRKLTCVSRNDDSALIWNYDSTLVAPSGGEHGTNGLAFQPMKSAPKKINECAIWNSTQCLVQWRNTSGWDIVNSIKKPAGPVFDYRWEDLKEFVSKGSIENENYQYVGNVTEFNTAVFSVRGSGETHVFLCQNKDPTEGSCFWIIIGSSEGKKFEFWDCPNEGNKSRIPTKDENCKFVKEYKSSTNVLDLYEWRTFRLEWISEHGIIRLFRNNERKEFLQGYPNSRHSVSHILVRSDLGTHVRFHFYDYFLTKKGGELSTEVFYHDNEDFCVELLVDLCPKCEILIDLINKNGQPVATKTITGEKDSAGDMLLTWRSTKLTTTVPNSLLPIHVQLKIRVNSKEYSSKGRWAINNFRMCKSAGRRRELTITTYRDTSNTGESFWPSVTCQKLSYSKSAVVDSLSMDTIDNDRDELEQFTREWVASCGSACTRFGENWSVCNPTGCTCSQGFKASGIKEFEKPMILDITDNSVRVSQKVKLEVNVTTSRFYIVIQEGARWRELFPLPAVRSKIMYEKKVQNLNPKTTYNIHTVLYVDIAGRTTAVNSPVNTFTTSMGERCFGLVRGKTSITVHLYKLLKGCPEILGINYRKLPSEEFRNIYGVKLPWNISELTPYTEYEIELPGLGKNVFSATIRTLESAPEQVRYFTTSNVTDTGATIGWAPPSEINGIITKYSVSIKRHTLFGCVDLKMQTPPQNEKLQNVSIARAVLTGLHPYANYTVTVIAYTLEPGPPNTYEFQTPEAEIPTSVVSDLRLDDEQLFLKWDMPANCTTISGPTKGTKLIFAGVSEWAKDFKETKSITYLYFELKKLNLTSYTTYKVRAFVIRDNLKPENPSRYQELSWTTAASAPPAVTQLQIYDADPYTNTISLRWAPPYPPYGEIESYHVSITNGNTEVENRIISASDEKLKCVLWENYICFEGLTLQPNITTSSHVQVYAKNEDVEENGIPNMTTFEPDDYNKLPGKPTNLTAIQQGHGVLMVTWRHPSFTATHITQFKIDTECSTEALFEKPATPCEMSKNYTFTKAQKDYTIKLYFPTSTKYRITIAALNKRNNMSEIIVKDGWIPGDVGFRKTEDLHEKINGSLINIKIPAVVNATQNTTVKVIVKGRSMCTSHLSKTSSSLVNLTKFVMEWEFATYRVNELPPFVEIPSKETDDFTSNCSLILGEIYRIMFVVRDLDSNSSDSLTSAEIIFTEDAHHVKHNLVWLIIFPIIAIFLLLFFILYQKRRKASLQTSRQNILQLETRTTSIHDLAAPYTLEPELSDTKMDRVSMRQSSPDAVPQHNPASYPVKVEEFEKYVEKFLATGRLNDQYAAFSKGPSKSCDYAQLPENVSKNRYKDRIPYDDTRVILKKIPDDPHSDYINASYIQGYRKARAYIATQGPKPKTVNDFWRMVCQEDVRVICMLANIDEGGKRKCEQYWPEIGTKVKYGDILISNTNHQVFADYTFRTFTLRYQKETREVTHLHYTGWPDHGVPMYTQSLVVYLQKLLATPAGNGPVIVHCSAGVGRTGTIILCDYSLRRAVKERVIDIPGAITRMREERANMVDNVQQYLLAHLAIVESMVREKTQIPCNVYFHDKIMELKKQLPSDIQRLKDCVWQDRALHCSAASRHLTQVGPTDDTSKLFSATFEKDNNIINAVSVDGVKMKKQYLASQLPSKSTLSDYWRLIAEKNIELVVVLQRPGPKDSTCCDIMPSDSSFVPEPYIEVETKSILEDEEHVTTKKLLITYTTEEQVSLQPVTVLTCKRWGHGKNGKPPTVKAIVSLWLASEKIQRKEGQTLVLCHDGIKGCGLYLALSFLLERIAVERECDVISAVRAVRRSKLEFVGTLEQFEFLYDAAVNYVKSFEIYSNFS